MSRRYQKPRDKNTAAFLALTLGWAGIHKIYLRQPSVTFFMVFLLFMTRFYIFPFLLFAGIFEAFRLFGMSENEFDRRYNRYASQNRKGDYLENRKRRQMERSKGRLPKQRPHDTKSRRMAVQKANPFKSSGIRKYKDFDLEGAIEDFQRGLDINKNDVALHFNIACAYSLTEEKEKAYYHLSKAVELGFSDFEMIETKDDLAFVRIQPEFESFKQSGYRKVGGTVPKQVAQNSAPATADEPIQDDVLLSQLNKLAELRKKGLLSAEEFNIERKKLMRR